MRSFLPDNNEKKDMNEALSDFDDDSAAIQQFITSTVQTILPLTSRVGQKNRTATEKQKGYQTKLAKTTSTINTPFNHNNKLQQIILIRIF